MAAEVRLRYATDLQQDKTKHHEDNIVAAVPLEAMAAFFGVMNDHP